VFSTVFRHIGPKVTYDIRNQSGRKKKSGRRLFLQMPSDAKAVDEIGKVLPFGHSSWV
jgi:hypothetical protein